jgi:hypothetical protein
VDVADDVERPAIVPAVHAEPFADDRRRLHLLRRAQDVDGPEPLVAQPPHRAAKRLRVVPDDSRRDVPVRPDRVAREADVLGNVEDDRDRQDVIPPGQVEALLAGVRLDVGRVDDREPPQL